MDRARTGGLAALAESPLPPGPHPRFAGRRGRTLFPRGARAGVAPARDGQSAQADFV